MNTLNGNAPKGQQQIAQGNALGRLMPGISPCKGKSTKVQCDAFAPAGRIIHCLLPRALPWAKRLLAFQAAITPHDRTQIYSHDKR